MISDFFAIYDAIADGVMSGEPVRATLSCPHWALVETKASSGMAMFTPGESRAPMYGELTGMPLTEAAGAVKSWNMVEASHGLAAANAFYNTPERVEKMGVYLPIERYYTDGLDLRGKRVCMIGHMRGPDGLRDQASEVYIIERDPKPGDYPDSACDWILPRCDVVIITGSSITNKTLPHLLELCRDAYTILTGPSVPMCPALLDMGVDRLAGMAITDREALHRRVRENSPGSPYGEGIPFLLKRD